jgi:hypothetical protein
MFLFGGNVEVEELDDSIEVGNKCSNLCRFPHRTLVSDPTVFHFDAPMIRFSALKDTAAL